MANYIVLGRFTDSGIAEIKDSIKRNKAFSEMARSFGATLKDSLWLLGHYDVFLKIEAPNDETVAALMLKAGSLGKVKTEIFKAFDSGEIEKILTKI